jgi:hypothetical protein
MLSFSGASLLSQNRQNQFFGDSFRYAIKDSYTINGYLLDLKNVSGISGILTQLSGMSLETQDNQIILINGTYFGLGRINSLNFAEGVDVKLKNYTCNFDIINSGNTFNLPTEPLYSGLVLNNSSYSAHFIDEFSENFSSEVSEDGSYTENQVIKLRFYSGIDGTTKNPITMAQNFASNLILTNAPVGFIDSFYSGWRRQPGRRQRQESINLITNEVSITETFKILKGISGTYSINYINSLNVNENSITTVSEKGRVQGLIPDSRNQYFPAAYSGEQYEVNNFSYLRCNNLFNSYQLGSSYPLNSRRLTYGQSLNKFSDTVDYEVSYSNDPRTNNSYSWEYTQNIERENGGCTYSISEDGQVIGLSTNCDPAARYLNALTAYSGVKTGVYLRTYNFYTGFSTFANPIKLINQSETKSKFNGDIKYQFNYSDNLLYSTSGVKKMSISLTDDHATPGKNLFDIPSVKQIAQPNNIPNLAKRSLELEIIGNRGTNLTGYLNLAKNTINLYPPTGTDGYISNLNYSFAPLTNTFNISTEWAYEESINLNQFIL